MPSTPGVLTNFASADFAAFAGGGAAPASSGGSGDTAPPPPPPTPPTPPKVEFDNVQPEDQAAKPDGA